MNVAAAATAAIERPRAVRRAGAQAGERTSDQKATLVCCAKVQNNSKLVLAHTRARASIAIQAARAHEGRLDAEAHARALANSRPPKTPLLSERAPRFVPTTFATARARGEQFFERHHAADSHQRDRFFNDAAILRVFAVALARAAASTRTAVEAAQIAKAKRL